MSHYNIIYIMLNKSSVISSFTSHCEVISHYVMSSFNICFPLLHKNAYSIAISVLLLYDNVQCIMSLHNSYDFHYICFTKCYSLISVHYVIT